MRLVTLFLVTIAALAGAFAVLTLPLMMAGPLSSPRAGGGPEPRAPESPPSGTFADDQPAASPDSGGPASGDGCGPEEAAWGRAGSESGRDARPARSSGFEEGPTPEKGADDDVRWAADPRRRELLQQLERAAETLRSDPYHAAALRDAAAAAASLGYWTAAADCLQRLLELEPQDGELRFQLAAVLIRLRRFVEAIPLLQELVSEQTDNGRAWFNLAVAHQALGHLSEARAAWDRAVELHPGDIETLAHRGEVLLDLHEWAPAAADFSAALKLDPNSTDCTLNLALAWQRMGRRGEARALLLDLLARRPRNVPALRRLVDICREELEVNPADPSARRDLLSFGRRLVEIIPDEPGVRELLERTEER